MAWPDEDQSREAMRGWWISVALATVCAGLLRSYGIGDREFWLDESNTFLALRWLYDRGGDAPLFVQATNLLYYVALGQWTAVAGESEVAYRAFSALTSTACVPVLALAARRIMSSRAALVVAVLATFHALHIYYGQEARAYAAWTLSLSVATWLGIRAAQLGGAASWGLYGLSVLVALGMHVLTLVWLPASLGVVLVTAERKRALRSWFVTTLGVTLLFAPYLWFVCRPVLGAGVGAWAASAWDPLLALPASLWALMPGGVYPGYLRGLSLLSQSTTPLVPDLVAMTAVGASALVGFVLLGVVAAATSRMKTSAASRKVVALAVLSLGPLVLLWAASMLVTPAYVAGRYDLLAWPAFVLLLGIAIESLATSLSRSRERVARASLVATLVIAALLPILRFALYEEKETLHYRRAAALARIARAEDLILCFEYDADELAYPLARAGVSAKTVSFPSWLDRQIGWVDHALELRPSRREAHRQDAAERAELVAETLRAGRQVWLLDDSLFAGLAPDDRSAVPQRMINQHLRVALFRAGMRLGDDTEDLGIHEIEFAKELR